MRILHIVGSLNRGGVETWLMQILQHVDRRNIQMDFAVQTIEPGAFDKEAITLGARVIPCLNPSNPLNFAFNFWRILRRYGPYDCIHSHVHHYSGYVLFLAAMLRVPIRIAHSHTDSRAVDSTSTFFRKAYIKIMEVLIQFFATKGIAVSESAAASLFSECWTSDARWSICPLGIDIRPFEREVNPLQVRTELGISESAFVVGHVGSFLPKKNHRFLVEVADQLSKMEPRTVILLVGDGPLRAEIETLIYARGLSDRFVLTGVRADVPRLMMGAMNCFLFPSSVEGLGLVVWEAQVAGLPCFIADAVPQEANLHQGLVETLSLKSSPEQWARQILRKRDRILARPAKSFPCYLTSAESTRRLSSLYGLEGE
jgi:glycosyltransferase involved in cell wall biosynthesis